MTCICDTSFWFHIIGSSLICNLSAIENCLINVQKEIANVPETAIFASTSHESAGAQSTHRPLAFPLAARSTILGWEHVTACTALILRGAGQRVNALSNERKVNTYLDLSESFAMASPC